MDYQLQKETRPFLEFLKNRFKSKIEPEEYYLAYSGGKDSHFLLWFIREYLCDNKIAVVGVNTSFEIPEIRDRILSNSERKLWYSLLFETDGRIHLPISEGEQERKHLELCNGEKSCFQDE